LPEAGDEPDLPDEKDFTMNNKLVTQNLVMGIDVCKARLDVVLKGKHYQYDNNEKGIIALLEFAKKNRVEKLVCEATGGYEIPLIMLCNEHKLLICRVNPRQVRDYAKASGKLAKTDKLDAKILVEFAGVFELQPTDISGSFSLSSLVRHRLNLVEQKAINLKQHGNIIDCKIKISLEKVIAILDEEISDIDGQIADKIDSDNELNKKANLLKSFVGIGDKITAILLAELPELGTISNGKITALAGLAPYNSDSGMKNGKRSIRGGRKIPRNALYMGSLVAMRYNPVISKYYKMLRAKGKCFKSAITACMHKILVILNSMLKNNQEWNEKYVSQH
jgi:transposase